jgi:hypothetical protein
VCCPLGRVFQRLADRRRNLAVADLTRRDKGAGWSQSPSMRSQANRLRHTPAVCVSTADRTMRAWTASDCGAPCLRVRAVWPRANSRSPTRRRFRRRSGSTPRDNFTATTPKTVRLSARSSAGHGQFVLTLRSSATHRPRDQKNASRPSDNAIATNHPTSLPSLGPAQGQLPIAERTTTAQSRTPQFRAPCHFQYFVCFLLTS